MKYDELAERGRGLGVWEVEALLLSLAGDERFPAVVEWLRLQRLEFELTAALPQLAAEHGKLAHASGGLHALITLEAKLRGVVEARPRVEREGPPEGEIS